MNTTQIDYFIAVAECLNFTRAAQNSYTSQPNVSKQIALLEKELGFLLFNRTKQSVELTNAGLVLYREMKIISKLLAEAIEMAEEASKSTEYKLKIGVSQYLDTRMVNKAIKHFQEKYEKSDVFIESVYFSALRSKLIQGHHDIAVSVNFAFEGLDGLQMQLISKHQMLLTCSKNHPLANKKNVTVADFKDDVFFVLDQTETPEGIVLINEICNKYGFSPKTETCNSLASYFINLELGYGVAIVDSSLRFPQRSFDSLFFLKIPEDIATVYVIAVWHANNGNPSIPLFLTELAEVKDQKQCAD